MAQASAKDAAGITVLKAGAQDLANFIAAVNRAVADERAIKPNIAVFREGKNFTSNLKIEQESGWFSPLLKDLLARGVSVVVNDIGLTDAAAASVEAISAMPADWVTQQNLYITPPDVQGFTPHCDAHVVVVAQLFGRKDWFIYDKALDNPVIINDEKKVLVAGPDEKLAVVQRFTVEAGDMFVIPRGVYHDACAKGGASAHLAIGCTGIRPIDCLWALAEHAMAQSPMRADMTPAAAAAAAGAFLTATPVPIATLPRHPVARTGAATLPQNLSFEEALGAVPRH